MHGVQVENCSIYRAFKVTKNTDALSIVMGHEMLCSCGHSLERMSHAMTINLSTTVADIFLGGAINRTEILLDKTLAWIFFQLGIMNPFGRKQEIEADCGLIFLPYLIHIEVCKIMERMSEKIKAKNRLFLSTRSKKN